MKQFFAFLTGMLTGALVGAVTALLLAPMSGDQLRQQAQGQFEDTMKDIRTTVEEERRRLEAELESLKRGEIKIA